LPSLNRPVEKEFQENRIKGAVRFDIDVIADKSASLPHMVPTLKQFEDQVSNLGINNDSVVICYDTTSQFMASARVWWMFRLYGHKKVYVLDKGFNIESYREDKDLIESGPVQTQPTAEKYVVSAFNRELLATLNQILNMQQNNKLKNNIIDARSTDRFFARVPEPRPGIVGGHIPNSSNLPFGNIIRNGSFLEKEELSKIFHETGVDFHSPIVTTCGSGVTACVLSLALDIFSVDSAVYDGSWSEYGLESLKNPISTE